MSEKEKRANNASSAIIKRQKAEEALRESQKFSSSLLENSPNPIFVLNPDTSVRYVNPAFEKLTGFALAEITGRKAPYPWWPKEQQKKMTATFKNAMVTGGRRTERNFQKKNGERFWAAVNSAPIMDKGKLIYFLINWLDITERKKAEQALADEATRRRILIDQSRDGIVVLDQNGKVYETNRRFADMLGYTPEEVAQLYVWDWEYLYPRERVLEMIRTVDEAGDHFETRHRRKDGSVYDVEISTNGAIFAGQKLIFCVCRDITERKKMERQLQEKNEQLDAQNEELRTTEEELRASNEELQAANDKLIETQEQLIRSERLAAIGQLASGVGHELRNPLGAIKNAGFYIRRRLANTDLLNTEPRVMEFLNLIDEEVNSANKVITDLLGFSRVAKPTVSPVSIAGVIEDALRHTPLPENVEIIKEINNNLPMVMVDADQIKQVFLNIAINAIQAMPEGGRLDIRATSKGKFVEVEFTDTGGGIPEEIKNKIFDPLFTTKAKGVGLGLSVCKSILERHEGNIRVKSQEGKGATFTLSLPTQRVPEGSAIQGKGGKDD